MAVEFEQRGPFAVVKINRPEARNAVNGAVAQGIEDAIDQIEADDSIWVGILTGEPPVFCAGADLKEINAGNAAGLADRPGRLRRASSSRERTKPLIAAVDGPALAGGTEIVLSCDLVVASTTATFGIPEVKRSLVAGAGGLFRLGRKIPLQHRHGAGAHRRSHLRRARPPPRPRQPAVRAGRRRSTSPPAWPSRSAPTLPWPSARPARSCSRPPHAPDEVGWKMSPEGMAEAMSQRGLPRGPDRLHREAPAPVEGPLSARACTWRCPSGPG